MLFRDIGQWDDQTLKNKRWSAWTEGHKIQLLYCRFGKFNINNLEAALATPTALKLRICFTCDCGEDRVRSEISQSGTPKCCRCRRQEELSANSGKSARSGAPTPTQQLQDQLAHTKSELRSLTETVKQKDQIIQRMVGMWIDQSEIFIKP